MAFRLRASLVVAAAAAGLANCVSTDTTGPGGGSAGPSGTTSNVRIVQGVSDAPNGVDVAVNGTVIVSGVPFGTLTPTVDGVYRPVSAAPELALFASGSTTAFYDKPAPTLAPNAPFTIVTLGRVSGGTAATATATILTDTTVSANGAVLVRVFNALDYLGDRTGTKADVYVYPQGAARPSVPAVAGLLYNTRSPYLIELGANFVVDVFEAGAPSTRPPLFTGAIVGGPGAVRTVVLLDPPATAVFGATGRALVLNDQR